MRFAPAGVLVLVLAACDTAPTAPLPPGDQLPTGVALEPLRDALERIAPTLGGSPAAMALRSALTTAVAEPSPAALAAVESSLFELEIQQPGAAVEADVIRLAVAVQR